MTHSPERLEDAWENLRHHSATEAGRWTNLSCLLGAIVLITTQRSYALAAIFLFLLMLAIARWVRAHDAWILIGEGSTSAATHRSPDRSP